MSLKMEDDVCPGVTNEEEFDQSVIKQGNVLFQRHGRVLQLGRNSLKLLPPTDQASSKIWKKSRDAIEIQWRHVVWAERNSQTSKASSPQQGIWVHYILQQKKKLRLQRLDLQLLDDSSDSWVDAILAQCSKVEGRPRKVFVVVNPIGGGGNGRQIFQKKVSPLLQLAHIKADAIFTERSKHALEIGEKQDFSDYDCVMVVGGDGLYQEVLQGMAVQWQKTAGVDYNNVHCKWQPLTKPMVVIPAGTGNGVSGWTNGVKDINTAVLRILTGEIHRSMVFTIHSNHKFFSIAGLLFGYGNFGDLIKRTDELRWMGRARYPYAMLAALFKRPRTSHYQVELCFAPDSSTVEEKSVTDDSTQDSSPDARWVKHDCHGRAYNGVFSFLANLEDKGDHLIPNLFTDRTRVYLDMGCSNVGLAKSLVSTLSGKKSEQQTPNLDIFDNVQAVKIRVVSDQGEKHAGDSPDPQASGSDLDLFLDVDGECLRLQQPEMEIRVVPSFVPLYSCLLE